jgi:hypothetical protein
MDLTLQRQVAGEQATCGELLLGVRTLYSVEQPWRYNRAGHSCVPPGKYDLVPYDSPKHGPTYCLLNRALSIMGDQELTSAQVAAGMRSFCELHSANWAEQLEGCIAFGLEGQPLFNPSTGRTEPAIEESRNAIALLMEALGWQPGHTLTIIDPPPAP